MVLRVAKVNGSQAKGFPRLENESCEIKAAYRSANQTVLGTIFDQSDALH